MYPMITAKNTPVNNNWEVNMRVTDLVLNSKSSIIVKMIKNNETSPIKSTEKIGIKMLFFLVGLNSDFIRILAEITPYGNIVVKQKPIANIEAATIGISLGDVTKKS